MLFLKNDIAEMKASLWWVKSIILVTISLLFNSTNFLFLHYIIIVYILSLVFWILYDLSVLVGTSINNNLILTIFKVNNFNYLNFLTNNKVNSLKIKLLTYMGNSLMVKL